MPTIMKDMGRHYNDFGALRVLSCFQVNEAQHESFSKMATSDVATPTEGLLHANTIPLPKEPYVDVAGVRHWIDKKNCVVTRPVIDVERRDRSGWSGSAAVHTTETKDVRQRSSTSHLVLNCAEAGEYIKPSNGAFVPVYSFDYVVDGVPVVKEIYDTIMLVKKTYPRIKCGVMPFAADTRAHGYNLMIDTYTLWVRNYKRSGAGNDPANCDFVAWQNSYARKQMEAARRGWENGFHITCVRLYDPTDKFCIGQLHFSEQNRILTFLSPRTYRDRNIHDYGFMPHCRGYTQGSFVNQSKYPSRMATTIKKLVSVGAPTDTDLVRMAMRNCNSYDSVREQLDATSTSTNKIAQQSLFEFRQLSTPQHAGEAMDYLAGIILRPSKWQAFTPPAKLKELLLKYDKELTAAHAEQADVLTLVPMFLMQLKGSRDIYYILPPHHPSWDEINPTKAVKKLRGWDTIYRASGTTQVDFPAEITGKISALTMACQASDAERDGYVCSIPCVGERDHAENHWDRATERWESEGEAGPNIVISLAEGIWAIAVSVDTAKKCIAMGEAVWTK